MFYDFVGWLVRLILTVFARVQVHGIENVPASGSFLLVANHLNLIDPPVLGALFPRRITFMAKEELFRIPLVGLVVRSYGAFSVRRGQADRQALRTSTHVLRGGGVLGIFPEGHRSETGKLIEAHPGAALIATMADSCILPVGITGTDRVRNPLSLLLRPRIDIHVGKPFRLERDGSRKDGLEDATRRMMVRVAELLPPEQHGFYAAEPNVGPTSNNG